ncbi:hypothetical protein D3C85_1771990 [compost metagenome]
MLGRCLGISDFGVPTLWRARPKNGLRQSSRAFGSIGHQVHLGRNAAHFGGVDVDANQLQPSRAMTPTDVEQLET